MKRRTALQLIAIGAAAPLEAQHAAHAPATAESAGELHFFSAAQNAMVDRLAEMILPADDHSPGAHEAQVSLFIDEVLSDLDAAEQKVWTDGLAAVDADANKRFTKPFLECSAEEQDQVLAGMAAYEEIPDSALGRFFVKLKTQTISGYYTSPIGLLQELEYKGIVPIAEFPPCTHPEHTQ